MGVAAPAFAQAQAQDAPVSLSFILALGNAAGAAPGEANTSGTFGNSARLAPA